MSNQSVCRIILLLCAVLVPAFGIAYGISEPRAVDPTWIRLSLSAVSLGLFGLSYWRRAAAFTQHFVVIVFGVITIWFWYLCLVNGFTENYALGMLYVHSAVSIGLSLFLDRLRVLLVFSLGTLALMATESFFVPGIARERAVLILCAASITALCYIATLLRLMAERSVYSSEALYRSLFTGASDAIILFNPKTGEVLEANAKAARLIGKSRWSIEGASLDSLPETKGWRKTITAALGREKEVDNLELVKASPESEKHLLANASSIVVDKVEAVLVILRDISERKAYEAKLIEAKQRAEEMSRLKSSFLNNISHELRTPLTGIIGFADVLKEKSSDEDREFLGIIRQSGERLMETVDSVLNLAQLDSEHVQLDYTPVDVGTVCHSTVEQHLAAVKEKGLSVSVQADEYARALGDESAFERIIDNLLSNSLKFTEHGTIQLFVRTVDAAVQIEVRDTGVGIASEFQPFIFDEFRQESTGLARDYEGSGLGLAIVQRLVEMMGGTIRCHSEKGVGTSMIVTVPAVQIEVGETLAH